MLFVSIGPMVDVTLFVVGLSISILHRTAFERQREWLASKTREYNRVSAAGRSAIETEKKTDQRQAGRRRPGNLRLVAILVCVMGMSAAEAAGNGRPDQTLQKSPGSPEHQADGADPTVRIGVLAMRGKAKCFRKWEPTVDYLNRVIDGYTFHLVPLDFDQIFPAVEHGEVDFILANSSYYVQMELLYHARRLATLKNLRLGVPCTEFAGAIFCRSDRTDIRTLKDLADKTFMAVSEQSFGGWLMAWRELRQHGIDPHADFAELLFGGTHDSVVHAVRDGMVDAGTVRSDTLERMAGEGHIRSDEFHIIAPHASPRDSFPFVHSTRHYPEWPMAAVAHTDGQVVEKVAEALLAMPADSSAAKAAQCAGWTIPHNYRAVNECLKELRVGPYKDYGKLCIRDVLRQYWIWMFIVFAAATLLVAVLLYTRRINRKLNEAISVEELRASQQAELAKFGQIALSDISLDDLFVTAVTLVSQVLKTKYAKVLEHRPEEGILFLRAGVGWKEGWVGHKSVPDCTGSQSGYTLLQAESVIVEDVHSETRFSSPGLLTEHNVVSGMSVAIAGDERPFGVLGVHTDQMQRFSVNDIHFLEAVANVLATSLQRRAVEDELRKLSTVVEQNSATIMITDLNGAIEYVNSRFTETSGYTAEEAIGRNPRILKSGEMSTDEYKHIWATITGGETWRGEFHNRRKNGELYWELALISPITDSQGNITRFLAIKEDITEMKRARATIQASEVRYRALYNSSRDAIILLSTEGKFLQGNPATLEMFGCRDEEEFFSVSWADLSPERQPDGKLSTDKTQEVIDHAIKKGTHFFEWTNKRLAGDQFFTTVLLTRMEMEGKNFLLATVRDITEQKNTARELVQAQKLESIGQLAAGIAHEINTPTQYVGDNMRFLNDSIQDLIDLVDKYADLLHPEQTPISWEERNAEIKQAIKDLDVEFLKEEIPNAIKQSLEGVDRITTIVRSMKEFAHPGGDDKQEVDLNQAIESTITVARNEWKYIAEVEVDFDPALPLVPCLVSEFNQVILNMIINAAHAISDVVGEDSGRKGTITISTRRDGDWAEIRVHDTGAGIPDSIREKVFDPFFTTKAVGKGSGQGLAIARATVVKKHGGTLGVESEAGQGTTFVIRLPIEGKLDKPAETECHEAVLAMS